MWILDFPARIALWGKNVTFLGQIYFQFGKKTDSYTRTCKCVAVMCVHYWHQTLLNEEFLFLQFFSQC